jgi:predicted dinucleotide-binding enzyme
MFRRSTQNLRDGSDVWLSPAPGRSVSGLARQLGDSFHVVVVPKTGTRRANAAVLTDPQPVELAAVAHILPETPVVAAFSAAPTDAMKRAAQTAGAHVMLQPAPEELIDEVRSLIAAAQRPRP